MPNNQLLRNAFPKWFEGKGIFASMTSTPWQDEIDGITLDIEYFGNRSGYKFCAPLVYNFLDEDGAVTDNGRQAIARVLLARYSKPWARLWNLMKSQYDPLDNFSITEEIDMTAHAHGQDKSNGTDRDSGTVETDHSGTDTNKSTGTEKTSRTGQNTSKDTSTATGSGSASRSGYNSTSPVTVNGQSAANSSTVNHVEIPNEDNTRTPDLTDVRTLALTDTDTRDITIERSNLVERENTQTDKGTRKRTGVSGLISRQRLVEQEREAWQWDFFESVFSDVDKIIALSVYDPCVMSQFDYTGGGTSGGYVLPIATQAALGGVRAPAKTDGSVQVQVDSAGFLYVPPYPKIPEPSGGGDIEFASTDKLGGIKLPSEPSGDGEEISTKNGVQFVVDKTLSPEGGYKEDDTVSVVIPKAGETPGLVTLESPDAPVHRYGGFAFYGILTGKNVEDLIGYSDLTKDALYFYLEEKAIRDIGALKVTFPKNRFSPDYQYTPPEDIAYNPNYFKAGDVVKIDINPLSSFYSANTQAIIIAAAKGGPLSGNKNYAKLLVVDSTGASFSEPFIVTLSFDENAEDLSSIAVKSVYQLSGVPTATESTGEVDVIVPLGTDDFKSYVVATNKGVYSLYYSGGSSTLTDLTNQKTYTLDKANSTALSYVFTANE